MVALKEELSQEDVKSIKDTLDVIDISIYDLLKKRMELITELNASVDRTSKNSSFFYNLSSFLASSIQKITEQRKYDLDILRYVTGIMNIGNCAGTNVCVGVKSFERSKNVDQYEKTMNNIRNLFPFDLGEKRLQCYQFDKSIELIGALATYSNMLAVIPAVKAEPKDVWWISLISPDKRNYKIIGKTPFDVTDDEDGQSDYLVAKTNSFYGFDRSVIAIATSETITNNWLKIALHKVNIPLYRIVDSTAIFNGTVLHLIEVSKSVVGDNDDIFKLNDTVNGINIRIAGYLGGYFLPLVDKDKIVSFSQSSLIPDDV